MPVVSYVLDMPVAEPNPVMRLHQVSFAMGAHLESGRQVGRRFAAGPRPLRAAHPARARAQGGRSALQPDVQRADHQRAGTPGTALRRRVPGGGDVPDRAAGQGTGTGGRVHVVQRTACSSGSTADRDAIPDIEEFAEYIGEAIDELLPGRAGAPPVEKAGTTGGMRPPDPPGSRPVVRRPQRAPARIGDRGAVDEDLHPAHSVDDCARWSLRVR